MNGQPITTERQGRDKSINVHDELMQNSIQLFLRKGFKGTTIQDIADSVGFTKGAFYWYFKSKEELLNAIIDHYEGIFVDAIINAVRVTEGNPLQKIKFAHKWATEFAYANRDLCVGFVAIAVEMAGSGTDAERKIGNIYEKYREFYQFLLQEGKAQGIIREDIDTDIVSHIINSIHNGTLLEWYLCYGKVDPSKFAIGYREVTLNGILKGT